MISRNFWLKKRKYLLSYVLLIVILMNSIDNIIVSFSRNIAFLNLDIALASDNISVLERQSKLESFVDWYELAEKQKVALPNAEGMESIDMLRAILIGQYYQYQRQLDQAARWYLWASKSEPTPLLDAPLLPVRRNMLLSDGNILIDDFEDIGYWKPATPFNVESVNFSVSDGLIHIAYENCLECRDWVTYSLHVVSIPLVYHNVLKLRVKIRSGSFLTLEVRLDDNDSAYQRYLDYYQGSGDWETLVLPLAGRELQKIKLSLSEPRNHDILDEYEIFIDWIRLEIE